MRDWIALYPSILDSEKWGELPDDTARLAWVVTLLLGARQNPEARFDSKAKLVRLLRKEGVEVGAVEDLIEAGCLDLEGEEVVVRGWGKWQRRWRGPSDDPEAKAAAERERYWRVKAERAEHLLQEASPLGSSPDPNLGVSGETPVTPGIEERRGEDREEKGGDAGATQMPGVDDPPDSLDRYYELTMLRPWGKSPGRWLREIEAGYGGPGPVREALDAAWAEDQDRQTLISRTEARLAKAADRVRQVKSQEVKDRPRSNGVDPEVAARQREVMAGMLGDAGKVKPRPAKIGGTPPREETQG